MPENKGDGEVLKTVSTGHLLQELSHRLAVSKDPKDQTLVAAIKDYSEVAQTSSATTELNSPEDEFAQAVKAVAIHGKFPQGLSFKEKELISPQAKEASYFGTYSPTGFDPNPQRVMIYPEFIMYCFSAIVEKRHFSPQAAELMKKHFLAVTPYDNPKRGEEYKKGYSLLIYNTPQDRSVVDHVGRYGGTVEIYFLMSEDKAQQFVQLVEKRNDGADVVEQFIQKAAPGVIAGINSAPGVRRVQASELVILDQKFLTNMLLADNSRLLKDPNSFAIQSKFLENVDKAVIKQYSQPVGFGTPPDI